MHDAEKKHVPSSWRLVQLAAVVLVFHVAHSLLQEEVFHLPGFHHALLLSLLQTLCISLFATVDYVRQGCERKTPLKYFVMLSVLALVASFATNVASLRLNYPTQVIFKSSKLLAVMGLRSVMMQHRGGKLTAMDVGSALAVVVGLCAFTFATHQTKTKGALHQHGDGADSTSAITTTATTAAAAAAGDILADLSSSSADFLFGVVAVIIAVAADALLYIVEEKYCFHTFGSSSGEIIVFLNAFAAANAGGAMIVSGNVMPSLQYMSATGVLLPLVLVYSLCNFIGTTAILAVVSEFGSPSAIIVTNTRKVVTILGSFVVYPKPFTLLHGVGLLLVTGGVYAHEMARKKKAAAAAEPASPSGQEPVSPASPVSGGSPVIASPVMLSTPAIAMHSAATSSGHHQQQQHQQHND